MVLKKAITLLSLIVTSWISIHAQETILPAGNEAMGSGGTSSYSVGQVVYTTNTGANGSVAQGVQQVYDISTSSGNKITDIILEMSVYPNPTKDNLTLKFDNNKYSGLSYQLFDINGKIINQNKLIENNTTIKMRDLPNSIYFLKVIKNNTPIKSFKIIKN